MVAKTFKGLPDAKLTLADRSSCWSARTGRTATARARAPS